MAAFIVEFEAYLKTIFKRLGHSLDSLNVVGSTFLYILFNDGEKNYMLSEACFSLNNLPPTSCGCKDACIQ